MKRLLLASLSISAMTSGAFAQSAVDAFRFSQPDMKGTARFMSMGGAFGALGGDLSSISQNPAGIGVYRSSEIGFTLDLDNQHNSTNSFGDRNDVNSSRLLLNNIGGVVTLKLNSDACPNINFGFTYNKTASFSRQYKGHFSDLQMSLSNYVAGIANSNNLTVEDVSFDGPWVGYNPYDGYSDFATPWFPVLGYYSYLINPPTQGQSSYWTGQWGQNTSGAASYGVRERGSIDSYNIAIGGNISNVVFWGMDFDIDYMTYNLDTYWSESLDNAYIDTDGSINGGQYADWTLNNAYSCSGTGFNYKLGFIVKPIQELRLGFSFHTPTWYNLTESYIAGVDYQYNESPENYNPNNDKHTYTNGTNPDNGYVAENDMNYRSPWRIVASAAGVIGGKFIISADYEWAGYNGMKFSMPYDGYWNSDDSFYLTNQDIKAYYQDTNTVRLGAEYRVTPQFSVRAGYSYSSSPVKAEARDNKMEIYTAGTMPQYRFDNETNYITAGLGYKYQKFYADLAYVYKHQSSTYHGYTPDPGNLQSWTPQSHLSLNNHQVVLSCGFKF